MSPSFWIDKTVVFLKKWCLLVNQSDILQDYVGGQVGRTSREHRHGWKFLYNRIWSDREDLDVAIDGADEVPGEFPPCKKRRWVGGDSPRSFNKHVNYITIPRTACSEFFFNCFWGYTGNEKSYPSYIWMFFVWNICYGNKSKDPRSETQLWLRWWELVTIFYTPHVFDLQVPQVFPSRKPATKPSNTSVHPGGFFGFDSKFTPPNLEIHRSNDVFFGTLIVGNQWIFYHILSLLVL